MTSVDAADALRGLAAVAAARPGIVSAGRYHYIQTQGWYLNSSQLLVGEQLRHLHSKMEEVNREIWLAEDGSGRVEEVGDGGRSPTSGYYASSELDFPTVPRTLGEAFGVDHKQRGRSPFRLLEKLWSSRMVTADLQAALLDALASEARFAGIERCTDRVGRSGIAIAAMEEPLGSAAGLYIAVLSEVTGALLAVEDLALEPADWLPSTPPCATSYTAFISAGLVDGLEDRPAKSYWLEP